MRDQKSTPKNHRIHHEEQQNLPWKTAESTIGNPRSTSFLFPTEKWVVLPMGHCAFQASPQSSSILYRVLRLWIHWLSFTAVCPLLWRTNQYQGDHSRFWGEIQPSLVRSAQFHTIKSMKNLNFQFTFRNILNILLVILLNHYQILDFLANVILSWQIYPLSLQDDFNFFQSQHLVTLTNTGKSVTQ